MINTNRKAKWNLAIRSVHQLDPHVRYPLLSLKRLDARLWKATPRLMRISENTDNYDSKENDFVQTFIGDAFFWALGSYEIVRTLDQRCRIAHRDSKLSNHFTTLKHQLERIRMPLAKLEPAKRYKSTDYEFSRAFLMRNKGYGWGVAKGIRIPFMETSDQVILILL